MLLMCHMLSAWLTLLALIFKVQDKQAALTELLFATWRMEDRLCWGGKLTVVSDLRGRGERIKELIKSTVNILNKQEMTGVVTQRLSMISREKKNISVCFRISDSSFFWMQ